MHISQTQIQGPPVEGAARIGRTGTKLHPFVKFADGYLTFRCACAGTANGFARNFAVASGLYIGAKATCKGAR